jgi:stage II sporulation protein D
MTKYLAGRLSRAATLLGVVAMLSACMDRDPLAPMGPDAAPLRSVTAESWNGMIRIGVVPSASTVTIGSPADFTIRSKSSGEVVTTGSNANVTVQIETPAQIVTLFWLQTVYTTSQAYIDAWLESAHSYGYTTMLEQHPTLPGKRLLIGGLPLTATWGERVAFRDEVISRGLAAGDSFWRQISEVSDATVRLTLGGSSVIATAPVVLESTGLVRIGSSLYRGVAEVGINSSGSMAGINELPIEEYLYGVVPRELGPIAFPELEAQKAQAVAARTYALGGLGKRRADGYDLLPTTLDQVYGGYGAEHPLSTQAVDETRGVVATYNGVFAQTLYSSTSGGFTANNEDVYNSAPVAYLRGKPDAERGAAFENVPSLEMFKRAANPRNLRAPGNGDFEADWSSYHRWVVDWSRAEMAAVLSASFATTVTEVYSVRVASRAEQGRVLQIEFDTDAGLLISTKDQIRSRLRYLTSTGAHASLRSTLFFIEEVVDPSTRAVTGWKAYGGGWGHGVGMCQTGAVGMAERGRSYQEILRHYYTGIDLVEWY